MDRLSEMYRAMREAAVKRGAALEQTSGVSEKFWEDVQGLRSTLRDLQDTLTTLEPPALEPQAIRVQQDAMDALKDDMDLCQADVNQVRSCSCLPLLSYQDVLHCLLRRKRISSVPCDNTLKMSLQNGTRKRKKKNIYGCCYWCQKHVKRDLCFAFLFSVALDKDLVSSVIHVAMFS